MISLLEDFSVRVQSKACSTRLLADPPHYSPAMLFPAGAADVIQDGALDLLSTHQKSPPKVCPSTSHILATASDWVCIRKSSTEPCMQS